MSKQFPKTMTIDACVDTINFIPFLIIPDGEGSLAKLSNAYVEVRDRLNECKALLETAKRYKGMLGGPNEAQISERQQNFELVKLALQAENRRLSKAWTALKEERQAVKTTLERNLSNNERLGLWDLFAESERVVAAQNCDLASALEYAVTWWQVDEAINHSKDYFKPVQLG